MASPIVTATSRNPTFFPANPSVDLFANVNVTTDGDDIDELVLTVTNVLLGANERLIIDGTIIELTDGNLETTGSNIGVSVSLSGTIATVTITPPAGFDATELAALIDGMQYENISATPGTARRVVTLTSVSDTNGPDDTAALSISSTASPSTVIELVSVSTDGVQVTSAPSAPLDTVRSVSSDGRFVVFVGSDPNLVADDTNGFNDIYLRDRLEGTTVRVNLASDKSQTTGTGPLINSVSPSISDDGRFVAFITAASLVAIDINAVPDLYVRDLLLGTTVRVSIGTGANGAEGNIAVSDGEISGNGQFAAFTSFADTLLGPGGDTNGSTDVFVRNLAALTTVRVSVADNEEQAEGASSLASISANGTRIAFQSTAANLIGAGNDTNIVQDIFLRDTAAGTTVRVSVANDESQANGLSFSAAISGDGNRVVFVSAASNLVAGDTNGFEDIFVRDIAAGTTIRISSPDFIGASINPSISANGRFVTFENDFNIWAYDIQTAQLLRLTVPTSGLNSNSSKPVISGDGSTVVFFDGNNDLVPSDANAELIQDVFAAPLSFSQPPTLDLDASSPGTGFTASYTENDAIGVLIADSDVTITDADVGDMIESATITVQSPLADDQLILGDQAGFAITGSGTASITIIGTGTVDQYEAIIQQIRFLNTGEDPTVGGTRNTRSINSVVSDGTSNSPTAITTVNITAINDEPTLTAIGLIQTFTEGGAAVDLFDGVTASTIEAGGQRFSSLTLTVSNVADGLTPGADEILTINGVDVALSNGNSVPLGGTAGTATVSLSGNIATVTVSGADLLALPLQTLIDGITYRNITAPNPSLADRVITITQVVDSGSDLTLNDNTADLNIAATVHIAAANDAPDAEITPAIFGPVDENVTLDLKNSGLSVSDADAGGGIEKVTLSVTEGILNVTAGNSGATVTNSGTASVTIEGTIAQINALLNTDLASTVSYVDNNDAPAATVTLTLAIDDQGNSGTGGPLIDQDTADISITAVNDKPDVTAPASYSGLPGNAITINNITFADVDGLGAPEQATFVAATGTFLAADAFGVTVTGSGTGAITLMGTTADLTTFITNNQLTYTVAASETITLTLNDLGNTGNGGALNDFAIIQVNIGAPPIIADLAGDTSTFIEDGAAVLLDDSSPPEVAATVTDGDSANFETGNLTVSIIGNLVTNEDVLGITTTANVTLSGSDILVDSGSGPVLIGTVTGGSLGSDLVVTFNANATPDAVGFLINALTYSNSNLDDPSPLQRTIAVTISDGDGAISNSENVLVNVVSVNEAPILLALNGDEAVFTENGPAVNVDVGANAGVSDSDSPDFDTGSLTVSITSGKVAAEDQLNIVDTGLVTVIPTVITPRFTIPGTVLVNGTTIGTITSPGGPGGGDLVITFNSSATPAAVAQLIQAIEYFNSGGDAPTAGVRGITYTLVDGDGQANGGADTATANTTVTVNAVNDDPAAAGVPTDITVTEDLLSNVDLSAITLTDGDSGLDNITLTLAASAGTLTAADGGGVTVGGSGSGSLTLTGTVAEVDAFLDIATSIKYTTALNAAGDNVATLTLTANDGGHNGMGGGGDVALGIVNIDSTAVNDAPVNQILLAPTNVTEDFASPIAGIVFTDVDAGGGTVLATLSVASGSINAISGGGVTVGGSSSARTLAGTIADINAFIAGSNLTFTTASNAVASVDLTVTLNDGGNTGIDPGLTGDGGSEEDTDVLTLAVGAVNDAPALAGLDNVPVFTENSASVVLDDNATISDSELDAADNYGGAMLTLARNGGANPQDSFGTSGALSFSGGNVLIGATTVGTVANAGGQLQIIFNGNATSALADSVLQQITYSNSSENPPASAQINYTFSDGNAGSQGTGPTPGLATGSITVTISAVNDAPMLSGLTATIFVPPAADAVTLSSGAIVSDVDSTTLASATVRVTAGSFAGANDVLAANTAGTSITAFYDPGTETLTLSGSDTLAHYQQVLASVTFDTTDTNPTNNGLNPTRTIEWQLNDGSGLNNLSSIATTTVNVSQQQSPSDFNGDSVSDVLWRLNNGFVAEWLMSEGAISQNLGVAQPDPVWHFQDTGDFGADGMADILWRHDSGQVVLWQMDGATILSNQSVAEISNDWHNEGVADFGGDGKADVLWHNDSGQVALWTMDGAQITNNQSVGNIDASWHVQGLLDTGGDGKSDVLLRNDSGQVVLWTMDGAQITANQSVTNNLGLDWNIVGTGDFGGDGKDDVLLRNDSGQVVIWTMDGNQIVDNQSVGTPGNEWQVQDVGDYNLDGKSDVLWRNDSGQVVLWEMDGNQIVSNHTVTNQGGVPAPIGLEWTVQNHQYDLL